jgi:hypothetical protein
LGGASSASSDKVGKSGRGGRVSSFSFSDFTANLVKVGIAKVYIFAENKGKE